MDEKETGVEGGGAGAMHKRRTTLEDGRYLIYYTFGDEADSRAGVESRPEPETETEAAEERRV
ncbi:MAG: hypothetical protein QOE46_1632 [Acidobacteriota bacterium]|jgi:hypothetical protein|nr:hypothetical protein [Acidobacteriota bacterium]